MHRTAVAVTFVAFLTAPSFAQYDEERTDSTAAGTNVTVPAVEPVPLSLLMHSDGLPHADMLPDTALATTV